MPILFRKVRHTIAHHRIISGLLLGLLFGVLVGIAVTGSGPEAAEPESAAPVVRVKAVSELSGHGALLPLIGTVESESEAELLTQRSGQVTSVRYSLGDRVAAGAVIATLESRSEQAAVAQAQANAQAAQANLAQLQSQLTRQSATTQSDALNAYRSAFITADNALNNALNPLFENDRTSRPRFLLSFGNDERIEEHRALMSDMMDRWERALEQVQNAEELQPFITQAQNDLSTLQEFLTEVAEAANRRLEPGDVGTEATDADRAAIAAARNAVAAALSTLNSLSGQLTQLQSQSTNGMSAESAARVRAAEAAVSQAQAGVRAALANLEETVIRAPIGGIISFINLDRGNFVGAQTPVVTITNPSALEVVTYISESDQELVSPGTPVLINSAYEGRVTRIAPSVNPMTGKIEVRIGLLEEAPELAPGASARVTLTTAADPTEPTQNQPIEIPLTALKLTAQGALVFTVSDADTLVAHPVEIERILGESVTIASGITPDMRIVVDARGRKNGEQVRVNQ